MLKYRPASHSSSNQGVSLCVFISLVLMGGSCAEGQYWDALVGCMDCLRRCQEPDLISRCKNFCENINCKTQPGSYYDKLLYKCIECKDVCGRHPPECTQHCQTQVTAGPSTLKDTDFIIYSVLAVCLALLLSSLFLAFVAFLRGGKAKTSKPGSTQGNKSKKKSEARPAKETGFPAFPARQLGKSSKDILRSPSCPVNLEPSDDSLPTETCVCVHCFPDMNTRGQTTSRPLRDPSMFYQQAVLQRAQTQNGGPCWTEPSFQTYGMKVQEEAAVG